MEEKKKDWFRYHRNEKNWFAQKLRRFMHQCAFVLATPQYQITVIRLNILQSSLTQKLSVETRTNEGSTHHCLLNLFKRNIWLLFDFFLQYRRKFNDFFLFCGFLKWRLSIFSSHMWLWIDNLNLIWLSVWCVGKFNFLRTLVAVIFRIWKLKKKCCPSLFFSSINRLLLSWDNFFVSTYLFQYSFSMKRINNNWFTMTTIIKLYLDLVNNNENKLLDFTKWIKRRREKKSGFGFASVITSRYMHHILIVIWWSFH